MFRTLLRPTSQTPSVSQISKPSSASALQAEGDSHWYSTRNFCNEFNNNGCDQAMAHGPPNFRKFHLCKICFRLEPTVLTDQHGASTCPNKSSKPSKFGKSKDKRTQ